MCADLKRSGEAWDENIEFGVMIEVPAAAFILDQVLPIVDFVSVGTNDLVQYLLAVDRDNPRVAEIYDPYHPAVLWTLHHIAEAATAAGKPASICGEIAGDHYYTMLLIGLGFRELSMAPVFLPRVKLMIRSFLLEEAQTVASAALKLSTATEVRELVHEKSRKIWAEFLGDAPHVGKSMGKLKRGNWSTHELERLRSLYPRSKEEHVARLLHRSVSSVSRKAREIFSSPPVESPWDRR